MNLQDTVGGWREFGFSAREAVHSLVEIHLRYGNAKGKGSKARKRAEILKFAAGREIIMCRDKGPLWSEVFGNQPVYMGFGGSHVPFIIVSPSFEPRASGNAATRGG